jgi:hypothetical protein
MLCVSDGWQKAHLSVPVIQKVVPNRKAKADVYASLTEL